MGDGDPIRVKQFPDVKIQVAFDFADPIFGIADPNAQLTVDC